MREGGGWCPPRKGVALGWRVCGLPFPSSSFRSHCCNCRWGEGVRVWGSQGSGTGVAGVRPTSSRPATSPLFPPLLLLQQCGGEGEGEGEGMEGVTSRSQPASSLSLLPLLWSGGEESKGVAGMSCCRLSLCCCTFSVTVPAVAVAGVPLQVVFCTNSCCRQF
ncbi:unnamed protein product [Closterium sp. NIES-54]